MSCTDGARLSRWFCQKHGLLAIQIFASLEWSRILGCMNPQLIFLPSVALVVLTYGVLFSMFRGRVAGMRKHQTRIQALADPKVEAVVFENSRDASDNFETLFEMPMLFYFASVVIFALERVDATYLVLSWMYVLLRVFHSYVHCTTNRVKFRFRAFAGSVFVLLGLWGRIAYQITIDSW